MNQCKAKIYTKRGQYDHPCFYEALSGSQFCEEHQPKIKPMTMKSIAEPSHTHIDERGFIVKCYHKAQGLLTSWQFWLGTFLSFPLEHLLWEKVWPFSLLTKLMGLG